MSSRSNTLSEPSINAVARPASVPFVPLRQVCKEDWLALCAGMVASFLLASIFMSGWPSGLMPDIHVPYAYSGDSLSTQWLTQRAMEGWIFNNERSGFPFGSSFLDYPGSDATSFLILKLLGLLTGSSAGGMNLYFLLGFPVNFLAAHLVLRSLRIGSALSFAAALLFAFAPFHFLRLGHLFYTWYFVVPIYFYLGLQIAHGGSQLDLMQASWRRRVTIAVMYLLLTGFGVYYTTFGMLVIGAACLVALFNRSYRPIRFVAAPAILFLAVGTFANIAPNVLNEHRLGHNPEVASRAPLESEVYGTKPIQLVLPRPGHRSEYLAGITNRYNASTPLVNENSTASLGMFGVAGLFILMLSAMMGMAGARVDKRLATLALISFVLLGFMVVGGLGSLFAHVVSPSIRGWNRASIFLSFSTIAAFALVAQALSDRVARNLGLHFGSSIALLMVVLGLWDQTSPACTSCNDVIREAYEQDRTFIRQVEHELPAGAAVYQLPYMGFPESPPINTLYSYGLTTGFIHSQSLRWSFAGMKGREGDLFYRSLSLLPASDQLRAIQEKGFAAVYIDTNGYADAGVQAIAEWTKALGHGPDLVRPDGKVVVFNLKGAALTAGTPSRVDTHGLGVAAPVLPGQLRPFLGDGWSVPEAWGVWSEGPRSTLRLPAPPKGVTWLRVGFNGFVPAGRELTVTARLGKAAPVKTVVSPSRAAGLTMDVPVAMGTEPGPLTLELAYDAPVSPQQAGVSADPRLIALGLTSLQWIDATSAPDH